MKPLKTSLRQNITNQDRQWFIIDADGKTLGKLSAVIADALRGKRRVDYTPHVDGGDYVVVLNAEKVVLTGNKEEDKKYYRHFGTIGNFKMINAADLRKKNPRRILEKSVSGMLAKNRHRKDQMRRLMLVIGTDNPYVAQKPTPLDI